MHFDQQIQLFICIKERLIMGRVKLKIKKIENNTNRQVTFSKRRNGLIKKAYELSVLCDIDLALIMFSPSNRLTNFSGKRRIEDVLTRFINLSDQEKVSAITPPLKDRENSCSMLESTEYLISTLNRLRTENEVALQTNQIGILDNEAVEEHLLEIGRLGQQLESAGEQLSIFEPDPSSMMSLEELESCEKQLGDILNCVTERKEYLLNNNASSSYGQSTQSSMLMQQQQMPTFFENNLVGWLSDNGQNYAQVFFASVPSIPLRDSSSAVYDPMLQGTSSNTDPQGIGECHFDNPDNDNLPAAWHHASYASADPNSSHLPPLSHLFSPIQQRMEEPGMMAVMPHNQGIASNNFA